MYSIIYTEGEKGKRKRELRKAQQRRHEEKKKFN